MEGHGLKPDGRFFEALVRVLATSPSTSPVARLRQQQEQQRQQQEEVATTTPQAQAKSALRKLPWGGAGPVAALSSCSSSLLVLFNTAIHACAAGGDWRLALDLLHDMKKEGLRPDYYSYQVKNREKKGLWGVCRRPTPPTQHMMMVMIRISSPPTQNKTIQAHHRVQSTLHTPPPPQTTPPLGRHGRIKLTPPTTITPSTRTPNSRPPWPPASAPGSGSAC